jgi:hypothetical protein
VSTFTLPGITCGRADAGEEVADGLLDGGISVEDDFAYRVLTKAHAEGATTDVIGHMFRQEPDGSHDQDRTGAPVLRVVGVFCN